MPDLLSIVWWRNFYARVGRGFGWGCLVVFGLPLVIGFGWSNFGGGGGRGNNRGSAGNPVIAMVNGESITDDQFRAAIPPHSGGGGEQGAKQAAQGEGAAMNKLVTAVVLRELADKYKVKVSDADVDRKVAEEREQILGKNATDDKWEDYVSQNLGISAAEYRDKVAKDPQLLVTALQDKFKAMQVVTPDDLKKQNQEVRATVVLIGYGRSMLQASKPGDKVLTEDQAKKKAEDLLAKVKSGGDIKAIARANSTDFVTKSKGGDTGFVPEYRQTPNQMTGALQEMLASEYGKELADAIHKTAIGQVSDVVKTSSFGSNGYAFARVEERREAPAPAVDPKNPAVKPQPTDPKVLTDQIKAQRGEDQLNKEFKAGMDAVRVKFTADGGEAQAYYDYFKAEQKDRQRMMAQFGQASDEPLDTPEHIQQLQTQAQNELNAQQAKHPTDSTLAILAGRDLKTKLDLAPSAEKAPLRDKLIAMYQTALQSIEDRDVRFELGDLYRDKGDIANADATYRKISRLMDIAPGYDTQALSQEETARRRLVTAFQSISKPEEAAAEQTKLAKVEESLAASRKKDADAQKRSQAPGGALAPGGTMSNNITLPAPKAKAGKPK